MSLDAATLVALAAALAGVLAYVAFGRGLAGKRAGKRVWIDFVCSPAQLLSFDWRRDEKRFFLSSLFPFFSRTRLPLFFLSRPKGLETQSLSRASRGRMGEQKRA